MGVASSNPTFFRRAALKERPAHRRLHRSRGHRRPPSRHRTHEGRFVAVRSSVSHFARRARKDWTAHRLPHTEARIRVLHGEIVGSCVSSLNCVSSPPSQSASPGRAEAESTPQRSATPSPERSSHFHLGGLPSPSPDRSSPNLSMPPRNALLRWPNGERTRGVLAQTETSELAFEPSAIAGPLAERCNKPNRSQTARAIEVESAASVSGAQLQNVRPKLLRGLELELPFDRGFMAHLARVAAGAPGGLNSREGSAFSIIVAIVLSRLASKCDNPSAVRGAADALQAGTPYFFKPAQNPDTGKYEGGLLVDTALFSSINPGGDLENPLSTSFGNT